MPDVAAKMGMAISTTNSLLLCTKGVYVIRAVYAQGYLTQAEAKSTFDAVFNAISEALVAGEEVQIRRFCTLRDVSRPPWHHLRTEQGLARCVPEGKRVKLHISDWLMMSIDPMYRTSHMVGADDDPALAILHRGDPEQSFA